MLYLVDYDREHAVLVRLERFENTERAAAEKARIQLELELNRRGIQREIVILEAFSEEALRRTHRRYFENLDSLAHTHPLQRV